MNNLADILEEDEPPLLRKLSESLYLLNKEEPKYALDELVADIALIGDFEQYEIPDLPDSLLSVYDTEQQLYQAPTVADFAVYQTQRWIDTGISFEVELEDVQDYLRYLGERSRSLWGTH